MPSFQGQSRVRTKSSMCRKLVFQQNRHSGVVRPFDPIRARSGHRPTQSDAAKAAIRDRPGLPVITCLGRGGFPLGKVGGGTHPRKLLKDQRIEVRY